MIYLSGAITNNPNAKHDFLQAQQYWERKGHKVVNPFAMCEPLPPDLSHKLYMDVCMAILPYCDTLVIINDISNSNGAKQEVAFAEKNRKEVITVAAKESLLVLQPPMQTT